MRHLWNFKSEQENIKLFISKKKEKSLTKSRSNRIFNFDVIYVKQICQNFGDSCNCRKVLFLFLAVSGRISFYFFNEHLYLLSFKYKDFAIHHK